MTHEYYQLPHGNVRLLRQHTPFPALADALKEPNGLIAIGGDLSAQRVITAYCQGIFPWYSQDEPILWWSPDPRMVLFPNELKIANSLKKVIKQNRFEIRINTAFEQVIAACGKTPRPNQDGTWITNDIVQAYTQLHQLGFALSVESWQDNVLVGGCYGVKIGHMFYGESMFYRVSYASKVAFVHLVEYLTTLGVGMIDCQMSTELLNSLGGREITRQHFIKTLSALIKPELNHIIHDIT